MSRRQFYSERHAVARMGRARRLVHRALAAIYFGAPVRCYPDPSPLARAWMTWWRTYRQTWPR